MSAKPTRQIERRSYHAWLRERWSYKPLVSRDEEWIRFGQRRQALLVLDIPMGSLIFTAIFAAHADPFLTVERRARAPVPPSGHWWRMDRDAASRVSTGAWRIQL